MLSDALAGPYMDLGLRFLIDLISMLLLTLGIYYRR